MAGPGHQSSLVNREVCVLTRSEEIDGCPMFALADMGRKRKAQPHNRFKNPPQPQSRVPHIPDFPVTLRASMNFMRLSLKKGAHADLSNAACRKFGASRSFLREMWDTTYRPFRTLPTLSQTQPRRPFSCSCDSVRSTPEIRTTPCVRALPAQRVASSSLIFRFMSRVTRSSRLLTFTGLVSEPAA